MSVRIGLAETSFAFPEARPGLPCVDPKTAAHFPESHQLSPRATRGWVPGKPNDGKVSQAAAALNSGKPGAFSQEQMAVRLGHLSADAANGHADAIQAERR